MQSQSFAIIQPHEKAEFATPMTWGRFNWFYGQKVLKTSNEASQWNIFRCLLTYLDHICRRVCSPADVIISIVINENWSSPHRTFGNNQVGSHVCTQTRDLWLTYMVDISRLITWVPHLTSTRLPQRTASSLISCPFYHLEHFAMAHSWLIIARFPIANHVLQSISAFALAPCHFIENYCLIACAYDRFQYNT